MSSRRAAKRERTVELEYEAFVTVLAVSRRTLLRDEHDFPMDDAEACEKRRRASLDGKT
jgi:hypothetical protein